MNRKWNEEAVLKCKLLLDLERREIISNKKEIENIENRSSSQDGGIGRYTSSPHTAKRRKQPI